MERFKNILFASCGGKEDMAAIDRASRLASSNQARLTLAIVMEEIPRAASYFLSRTRLNALEDAARTLARNHLQKLAGRLDPAVKAEIKILTGKPFIELIRAVLSDAHDLIIKPKNRSGKKSLDSTDLHLLRKCPCPLWIIKPTQRKPFGKILIAVDPDPSDPEKLRLHADLLKIGISLAKIERANIDVVHAWQLDGEEMLRGPRFRVSQEEISTLAENVQKTRREWLDRLLLPYADTPIRSSLFKGEPGPTLAGVIEKKKPDIVVMGTVARTGLPGLLVGNTAEFVLEKISCSILTIKPRSFATPVS